jgi:hypothetical protein
MRACTPTLACCYRRGHASTQALTCPVATQAREHRRIRRATHLASRSTRALLFGVTAARPHSPLVHTASHRPPPLVTSLPSTALVSWAHLTLRPSLPPFPKSSPTEPPSKPMLSSSSSSLSVPTLQTSHLFVTFTSPLPSVCIFHFFPRIHVHSDSYSSQGHELPIPTPPQSSSSSLRTLSAASGSSMRTCSFGVAVDACALIWRCSQHTRTRLASGHTFAITIKALGVRGLLGRTDYTCSIAVVYNVSMRKT